jgi:hypothetical protein
MSYERQLKCERFKEELWAALLKKPHTRLMIMRELNVTKTSLGSHLQRMVFQGYIKIHPVKVLERERTIAMPVTQYVANPRKPYVAKVREQLAKETTQRFTLGPVKERRKEEVRPGVQIYRLLDNPLPRPETKPKKIDVGIGSSFALIGW